MARRRRRLGDGAAVVRLLWPIVLELIEVIRGDADTVRLGLVLRRHGRGIHGWKVDGPPVVQASREGTPRGQVAGSRDASGNPSP